MKNKKLQNAIHINAVNENKDCFMEKWKKHFKSDNLLQIYKAQQFIKIIEMTELIKGIDADLYFSIIEKMIVFDGKKIIVSLLDEIDIEVVIE